MVKKVINYLRLIRIKQYIKNGLIFLPLLFARSFSYTNIFKCVLGFAAFSLIASSIYMINDLADINDDRKNIRKKTRPLASGEISKVTAIISIILFLILSMVINYFIKANYFWSYGLLILYFVANIFYSLIGKKIPMADIFSLMAFYIIRIYYGAKIISVPVSSYLFLTVMSSALFLAFGKRNKEYEYARASRPVLERYNKVFLDRCTYLCMTLTAVFYSLWVMEQNISHLHFSVPIMLFILMRYSLVLERREDGDPTNIIFSDIYLILFCIIYIIYIYIAIFRWL